jgi:hypothetical protein
MSRTTNLTAIFSKLWERACNRLTGREAEHWASETAMGAFRGQPATSARRVDPSFSIRRPPLEDASSVPRAPFPAGEQQSESGVVQAAPPTSGPKDGQDTDALTLSFAFADEADHPQDAMPAESAQTAAQPSELATHSMSVAAEALGASQPEQRLAHHWLDDLDPTPAVPYDETLLERARTQWQFGDWPSLAALTRDTLQHHPDRAKLALLAAAGHQQLGDTAAARQFTRLAQDWGCSKKLVAQVLIAGAHNTLARVAAAAGQVPRALKHFQDSIAIGTPNTDLALATQARVAHQCLGLGLALPTPVVTASTGSFYASKPGTLFFEPRPVPSSKSNNLGTNQVPYITDSEPLGQKLDATERNDATEVVSPNSEEVDKSVSFRPAKPKGVEFERFISSLFGKTQFKTIIEFEPSDLSSLIAEAAIGNIKSHVLRRDINYIAYQFQSKKISEIVSKISSAGLNDVVSIELCPVVKYRSANATDARFYSISELRRSIQRRNARVDTELLIIINLQEADFWVNSYDILFWVISSAFAFEKLELIVIGAIGVDDYNFIRGCTEYLSGIGVKYKCELFETPKSNILGAYIYSDATGAVVEKMLKDNHFLELPPGNRPAPELTSEECLRRVTSTAKAHDLQVLVEIFQKVSLKKLDVLRELSNHLRLEYIRDPATKYKYLDMPFWILKNLHLYRRLEGKIVDWSAHLDIGCGGGFLCAIAQHFGNSSCGLDVQDAFYHSLRELMGVVCIQRPIIPFEHIETVSKYTIVTAIAQKFDEYTYADQFLFNWNKDEWIFFFSDIIENLLAPGGAFYISLNHRRDARNGINSQEIKNLLKTFMVRCEFETDSEILVFKKI